MARNKSRLTPSFFSMPPRADEDGMYGRLRDYQMHCDIRDKVEESWQQYAPLCPDSDFPRKAQQDFLSMYWQMHLTLLLRKFGFSLRKSPADGPDISIDSTPRAWIECTAPKPGTGLNEVFVPKTLLGEAYSGPVPEREILLRITSAIKDKDAQRACRLKKGMIGKDDHYLLAINGGLLGPSSLSLSVASFAEMAVFGIGSERSALNPWSDATTGPSLPTLRSISKYKDLHRFKAEEISTLAFRTPQYKSLSALLWSPYWDTILRGGDDITTIYNSHATNPLSLGYLGFGSHSWLEETSDGNVVLNKRDTPT